MAARKRSEPAPTRQGDLERLRVELLAALDAVDPRDKPRVSRELRGVLAELAELAPPVTAGSALQDELRRKRDARRAAAQG